MSRRAALLVLCALAVSLHAKEIGNANDKYDTIVVGLGAAGAAALRRLAGGGRRALALEAAGRVGGRVNTTRFGRGRVELGAEWIHGQNGSRSYALALENGVPIEYQEIIQQQYISNGTALDRSLEAAVEQFLDVSGFDTEGMENMLQVYVKVCTEYMSSHRPDVLRDESFFAAFLRFIDLYIVSADAATSTADLALDDEYVDLDDRLTTSWAGRGYKTLFEILLNTFNSGPGLPNADIKLSTPVTRVEWGDEGCVVTAGASTYAADHCIVTVSLGVLKKMHKTLFSPPLPQDKVDAIETLAMGVLDKVIFSFDDIWWQFNIFSSYWHSCPLTHGSYSYDASRRGPGAAAGAAGGAGAGGRARAALARPLAGGRLQLAGEATHRTRHSTVHGALETGERAADVVLSSQQ